jgi:hypothetical protein
MFIADQPLFVAVQSGHQQIYPKESEKHYEKADNCQNRRSSAAPAGCHAAVQQGSIDKPGYQ